MQTMQTKHVTASVTKADAEQRTVEAIVSTATEDRYGEIVEQSWRLDAFRRNPVILFAHNPRELPIGRAEAIDVVDGQLRAVIRFAPTNRGEEVYQLFRSGMLSAFSVGFRPGTVRTEQRDGREIKILADNELLEISAVAIPANPEALAVEVRSAPKIERAVAPVKRRWSDFTGNELHALAVNEPARFLRLLEQQRAEREALMRKHPQYAERR